MVVGNAAARRADEVLHALADETRRDIVRTVLLTEQSVSALARRYPMSVTAVQKHVAVLERARLVTKRRQGREALVRGNVRAVREARAALDALETVWRDRVAQMDRVLAEDS
jgi:DNA-binding transcriptional ArsR family regulator